jgi:peptidyl-prolyl cis-trans isomerase B (cyclophilin B)
MKNFKNAFLLVLLALIFSNISCAQNNKSDQNSENQNTSLAMAKKSTKPQYEITIKSNGEVWGKIVLELFPDLAPKHVQNFDSLVSVKFYDGCAFHRVIPGFMIQGGDPNSKDKPKTSWGMGDPNQTKVPAEFNKTPHKRGILSAARAQDPNSATSQFFIVHKDANFLDGQYTVYGEAISGMEIVDKIVNSPRDSRDNPNDKIEMYIKKLK